MIARGALRAIRGSEPWLFLAIFIVIGILVLPVPTILIDGLLAMTMCLAMLMVVFAVRVQSPTELSTFPSVLLFITVFRIAIDVSVTRSILVNGDAGQLVVAFGHFVAGGSVGIGLMVFLTITVVQFIVIAKGSERVAEVAARFTLDGLPGRQMSIDADLRNGVITEEQATERRVELERETQFHGAMDGAVRFVKGDVIACLIIVLINLIGGIAVGVIGRDLDFADAVNKYSILSIGGGLISQIGSVLTALAAALLTTRSSKDGKTDLGTTFVRQFSGYPSVLIVVGCGCFFVAFVPGLPWGAFVLCGVALIGYGARQSGRTAAQGIGGIDDSQEEGESSQKAYQIYSLRTVPDIAAATRLVLSRDLASLRVLESLGRHYAATSARVFDCSGIRLPTLEILVLDQGEAGTYQIVFHGVERARGVVEAKASKDGHFELPLIADFNARTWEWKSKGWVDGDSASQTVQFTDAALLLAAHLDASVNANLHRIPTIGDLRKLLCSGGKDYAAMLADLTRSISLVRLSGIVRRLIQDGVPLHNVRALMAGLLIADPAQKDDDTVVNLLRLTLRDSLCARLSCGKNELYVVELGDHLALELSDASQRGGGLVATMLPPERVQGLREQITQLLLQSPFAQSRIAVIAASQVRVAAADVLRFVDARTSVLAWDELSDDLAVRSLGTLE